MSDPTQASAAPAAPAPQGAAAPAPAPSPPTPGSAEHKAAMIAAYDAQFAKPAGDGVPPATQAQTAAAPAAQAAQVDPNAPAPKLTDPPAGEKAPAEGEKAPVVEGAKPFDYGQFSQSFNAEKLDDGIAKKFGETMGFSTDEVAGIHKQFREGQLALQRELTSNLHKAAGGAEQFNALVAWGQKNMTAEQRQFYDAQLNGPNAAEAIAVLRQRMSAGSEPHLHNVNASAQPSAVGFGDKTQMMDAMRDPRYQTSEAYRAEVAAKLRVSRF